MSYFSKHKEGIVLSVVFHVAILAILIIFGFFTPLPLPEEEGIMVEFGTTDQGMGTEQPMKELPPEPTEQEPVAQPKPVPEPPKPEPVVEQTEVPVPVTPEPEVVDEGEELLTQQLEEAAKIKEAQEKARKERERREQDSIRRVLDELDRLAEIEKERLRQEAIKEQRRKDSLQKIENARLERLRQIAEQRRQDSIKKAKEQAKINEIASRAKNAFGGGGNASESNSSGQGVTYKPGNQGAETGDAGSPTGTGLGSQGVSFSLDGRTARALPKPSYPGNNEGVVVVEITVDKYGNVTKAIPGARGSTSLAPNLMDAAKKAALTTKFNVDNEAPAFQVGTITYRFVLD